MERHGPHRRLFQSAGSVELKCVGSVQWHTGTPEMNAIKVGALYPAG